jgi:hypothetical protein
VLARAAAALAASWQALQRAAAAAALWLAMGDRQPTRLPALARWVLAVAGILLRPAEPRLLWVPEVGADQTMPPAPHWEPVRPSMVAALAALAAA